MFFAVAAFLFSVNEICLLREAPPKKLHPPSGYCPNEGGGEGLNPCLSSNLSMHKLLPKMFDTFVGSQ